MFNWPMKKLHIELTSKCALACPLCPRNIHEDWYKNKELDYDLLKERLTDDILDQLDELCFSGVYGDPIYHQRFADILQLGKRRKNIPLSIETNGSGRTKSFWEEVSGIFDRRLDSIIFSIDGLEDTNHLYRVNSRWQDIMDAIDICRERVNLIWKFIIFDFNENQVELARELSKKLGFNKFIVVHSCLMSEDMQDDRSHLSKEQNVVVSTDFKQKKIYPKCQSKERHFISADGYLGPCCWLGQYHARRELWGLDVDYCHFDLRKYAIKDILSSLDLQRLSEYWASPEKLDKLCLRYCHHFPQERSHYPSVHTKYDFYL